MPPVQRHEHDRDQQLDLPRIACAPHALQHLLVPIPNRQDHSPAVSHLTPQRAGDGRRGSRHDNRVVGSHIGQALAPIPNVDLHVVIAQIGEQAVGVFAQIRIPLQRVDDPCQPAQHRRLIPAAGADLQHGILHRQAEHLRHQRHDVRLRDRLAAANGERVVIIRQHAQVVGQKAVARNRAHRVQHARIVDVARFQLFADHPFAEHFKIGLRSHTLLSRPSSRCTLSMIHCPAPKRKADYAPVYNILNSRLKN